MAIVVVKLTSEYLPDGSFHVYSPEVPGFHVVEPAGSKTTHKELFEKKVEPLLRETMERRVTQAEVGKEVWFRDDLRVTDVANFIPDELRRTFHGKHHANGSIPTQLIAEIK
jgi:hypothetical protein